MASVGPVVPILRIFDERKARDFYLEFLGFKINFEHRFGENFPLYIGISRADCHLHLSEHYGDASPGAHLRIHTDNIDELARELTRTDYRYAKPGKPETTPWGDRQLTVTDPFSNRLTFVQRVDR
jgi:uncharacterized glyoxalase superfamily protein PhnB